MRYITVDIFLLSATEVNGGDPSGANSNPDQTLTQKQGTTIDQPSTSKVNDCADAAAGGDTVKTEEKAVDGSEKSTGETTCEEQKPGTLSQIRKFRGLIGIEKLLSNIVF